MINLLMKDTSNRLRKKISGFFFFVQPDFESIPFLDRIKVFAFYAIVGVCMAGTLYNIKLVWVQGKLWATVMILTSFFLTLSSIPVFWITRKLKKARNMVAVSIIVIILEIIIDAGGVPGFGVLYFIAGYPVLYLLFGLRIGNALAWVYYLGVSIRLMVGGFDPGSMYQNPIYINRVLVIMGLATILGVLMNGCTDMFVRHISRLALQDPTTQLPNRYKIEEYLRATIRNKNKSNVEFSVIGIKILNLNKINAILGTDRGDMILNIIAERMRSVFFSGRITGRWSGSLFISVLDTADFMTVESRCEGIIAELSRPYTIENHSVSLLLTIAVCRYPVDAKTVKQLLGNVISQLDRQQNHPGEVVFFNEANLNRDIFHFALTEAMGKANLDKELSLVYQPKIRFADDICVGAEILLRWIDSGMNEIIPSVFIPVAEQTGFVKYLTRWVIHRVFSDLKAEASFSGFMERTDTYAINLSVVDLKDRELITFLNKELKGSGCRPERIEFEITEGMLVDEDPQIKKTLESLMSMGFHIAIDDFGTGYSSLSYLHTLRAHNLKIDQSFVRMITPENLDKAHPVIDAIIAMGTSLGLEITAEGVETEEQAAYLRVRGCHTAQGWLYSKGLSFGEYERYRCDHS